LGAYSTALRRTFGGALPTKEDLALNRDTIEIDRTLAFFDGQDAVATAGIVSYAMTVPGGGELACGGVTAVTVSSTHRRRGLLRAMMRRQLDDINERGEPLAVLFASEAPIYGRFGYGLATYQAELEIARQRAAFLNPLAGGGRLAFVDAAGAAMTFPGIWDSVRREQPGMLRLDAPSWRRELADLESHRLGFTPHYRLVYEADGAPSGFALYRIKMDWDAAGPIGMLRLEMLIAATPQAYEALWRHVLDVDLITRVTAWMRPIAEPLRFLLADPRQPVTRIEDGLWLRLVDVTRALEGRRYAAEDRLVLDLRDEFCPWNSGRYELLGGPSGAQCRRSTAEPDLEISAAELGAVYLGGNRLRLLHEAGRVTEHRAGAVTRADAMFASDRVPWCPSHF
jgi:predicted acetyltransferase